LEFLFLRVSSPVGIGATLFWYWTRAEGDAAYLYVNNIKWSKTSWAHLNGVLYVVVAQWIHGDKFVLGTR
jgi:hypothetical protein